MQRNADTPESRAILSELAADAYEGAEELTEEERDAIEAEARAADEEAAEFSRYRERGSC